MMSVRLPVRSQRTHASRSLPVWARTAVVAVMAASGMLAGCSRSDNETAGEKLDAAVARADRKAEDIKADVRQQASDMQASAGAAAERMTERVDAAKDQMSSKVDDAAITASVNAELAKDAQLSALRINVDTTGGHVLLKGTAPDRPARERATQLASSVKGVVSVDNQLVVRG